ncbi:class I SAM-dependent methyltransferase [Planctomycetota bacterium]
MTFIAEEKGYQILQCPECGFITTDPIPSAEELAAFYAEHFLSERKGGEDYWESTREPVFRQIETLIAAAGFDRHCRILDVGAAYGAFLKTLKDRGYTKLTGIDLSGPAVAHMRKKLQVEAIEGDLSRAALPPDSFDAVTLIDTLEHLPDFNIVLREIGKILRPGGIAIVRVPNMNFHLAKSKLFQHMRWPAPYGLFTPPGHLNHFTPQGLARALAGAGLSANGSLNGIPDTSGGRGRIGLLAGWYRIAQTVHYLSNRLSCDCCARILICISLQFSLPLGGFIQNGSGDPPWYS